MSSAIPFLLLAALFAGWPQGLRAYGCHTDLYFSRDGSYFAGRSAEYVRIGKVSGGAVRFTAASEKPLSCLFGIAGDNSSVAAGNMSEGELLLLGLNGRIKESRPVGDVAALSPGFGWAVLHSYRSGKNYCTAARLAGGKAEPRYELGGGCDSLAFSPDEKHIAYEYSAAGVREFRVLRLKDGQFRSRQVLKGALAEAAFSPDGKYVAYADHRGGVYVLEAPDWKSVAKLSKPGCPPGDAAFSADSRYLAVAYCRDSVSFYSVPGFELVSSRKFVPSGAGKGEYYISDIKFHPGGNGLGVWFLQEKIQFISPGK